MQQAAIAKRNAFKQVSVKRKQENEKIKYLRTIFTMVAYDIAAAVQDEAFMNASRQYRKIKFYQKRGWRDSCQKLKESTMDVQANEVAASNNGWAKAPPLSNFYNNWTKNTAMNVTL